MTPFIKVNNLYTIFTDIPITIGPDHPHYKEIAEILDNERNDDLTPLLHPMKRKVEKLLAHPNFRVVNGQLFHNGNPVYGYIVDRIFELIEANKPIARMLNFLEKLLQNPSNRVYEQLFKFLETGSVPITEDGDFLAYKRINKDYTDVRTGKIFNRVGDEVSMPRQQVDDNPNNTCSHGLHVCSFDYIANFSGERLVVVKVNPCDVVSIPVDYNHTKMRVCRYKVISEIPIDTAKNIWAERFVNLKPEEPEEEPEEERWYSIELESDSNNAEEETTTYFRCLAKNETEARDKAEAKFPYYYIINSIDVTE